MSRTAEITMGLLLFAGTFVLAGVQGWSASDLMWGLWISSLTLGYATIVLSIVGPLAIGDDRWARESLWCDRVHLPRALLAVRSAECALHAEELSRGVERQRLQPDDAPVRQRDPNAPHDLRHGGQRKRRARRLRALRGDDPLLLPGRRPFPRKKAASTD